MDVFITLRDYMKSKAAIIIALGLYSNVTLANSELLLSQAIKSSSEITNNISTKQRLNKYEEVFNNLNQIKEEYPASREAISLFSNQITGDFDPAELRLKYVEELATFNDKVCETSPSFTCLGFVSLKSGTAQCRQAQTLPQLVDAHNTLLNSIEVFIGQDDKSGYDDLAMDTYRSCLSMSSVRISQWSRDSFASQLIPPLLKKDKKDRAKAIIEQIKTPYFKFESVLELQEHSSTKTTEKNIERLDKYIKNKLPKNSADAFLASVRLANFAMTKTDMPISYSYARKFAFTSRPWKRKLRHCDDAFTEYLYDVMTEYQLSLYKVDKSRLKLVDTQMQIVMLGASGTEFNVINQSDTINLTKRTSVGFGLDACENREGEKKYSLMALMHGYLLLEKGEEVAQAFKNKTQNSSMTEDELYDYYIDQVASSESKLKNELDNREAFYVNLFYQPKSTYPVFKKYVDFGNVCESSKILFQELKGTKYYNSAIKFMLQNPNVTANKKYSCGDEDLELLLN